jgi:hypothetical protein
VNWYVPGCGTLKVPLQRTAKPLSEEPGSGFTPAQSKLIWGSMVDLTGLPSNDGCVKYSAFNPSSADPAPGRSMERETGIEKPSTNGAPWE